MTDPAAGVLVVVVVGAALVWGARQKKVFGAKVATTAREATAALEAEYARLRTEALAPTDSGSVVRQRGETFYWQQPANLWKVALHSELVGRYAGASFRVARGMWVRTGGSRGHVQRTSAIDDLGPGTVCVSDARILFVSPSQGAIEIKLAKILSFERLTDGIELMIGRQKPMFLVTGDARLGIVTQRVINGDVAAHVMPSAIVGSSGPTQRATAPPQSS